MNSFSIRSVLDDVLICVGFFTRIPVSGTSDRWLAEAIWAVPAVGILVGFAGATAFWVATRLGLPPSSAAVAALAATMLLTGCLHEDGLADVADGFGGGATRGRKLEIMRDSRIGTFGVAALALGILGRWSALSVLPDTTAALFTLVATHAASRAVIPLFMTVVPRARSEGLSAHAGSPALAVSLLAAAAGIAVLVLSLGIASALAAIVALVIWFGALKALCERQIGGQTGDVLGALQQGAELIVLLAAISSHA